MRRVRRKVANKEKVFGCDLLEHLNTSSQDIPQVLRCCTEFVEQHGIVDGIYRLSGVSSNIQKLRSEFESDGTPDLNKEVYLQDIHCVSSLCKAYFRELPNPLLTYQLYDKFAEAVAVQLEEERLVKIRDVLKELPVPHYRTLEFLMCHLVKMASYSPETNMHARNLAIVWAPNLLRSKDIEVSGFNGTAAFMEVRIQSIVVEFILTHVAQLFSEPSVSCNRRKSLPSPVAISTQEEPSFKSQPPVNFGNISPGDGPLPIRPYHAIIEGTDKRKGSFKGRKWMSIFNIGSRFHDPRRRHKHSAKEKDRPVLRPARSMDSLSIPSYSNEDSRRPLQTSNSTKMSCLEAAVSPSLIGGSEYAVTYRRGTGLVSGGTQGTYTALDPEGLGSTEIDNVLSKSPGLSTKAGRRAAMHITGPITVTVPLHITPNLALGVLHGGGSDRVVHRGRDKEGGEKVEVKEERDRVERKDSGQMEEKMEKVKKVKEVTNSKDVLDEDVTILLDKEEGDKNEKTVCKCEIKTEDQCMSKEARAKSLSSTADEDVEGKCEYKEMQEGATDENQQEATEHEDNNVFGSSNILDSKEVEHNDDQELSGYVQDNFEFLDQMDCSTLDHMDGSVSCQIPLHFLPDCTSQVNEFSVEPPGHSDNEYELMEHVSHHAAGADTRPSPETSGQSQFKFHRPSSVNANDRQTKSLSLPPVTSPVCGPEECCSDEDTMDDDIIDDYSSDEEASLFVKSLPPDFFLNNLCDLELDGDNAQASAQVDQRCEVREFHPDFSTDKEPNDVDEVQGDMEDGQQKEIPYNKENSQRTTTNEDLSIVETGLYQDFKTLPLEAPSHQNVDLSKNKDTGESTVMTCDVQVDKGQQEDEGEEQVGHPQVSISCGAQKETSVLEGTEDVSVEAEEEFKVDQDGGEEREWTENTGQGREETGWPLEQKYLETKRSISEALTTEDSKELPQQLHSEKMECHSGLDDTIEKVWDELEEIICELIEDEERKMSAKEVGDHEDAQVSAQNNVNFEEEAAKETKFDMEAVEDEMETTGKDVQDKTNLAEKGDQEAAREDKHSLEEVTPSLIETQLKEISCDVPQSKEAMKFEQRGASHGGVGRKLVISKPPRVYQVKAVPMVPPKPQHCKLAALTLRQQQQQREKRDADMPDEDARGRKESDHRRDGDDVPSSRDSLRNSSLSLCFDEAVAIATMRREKEKECERERQRDWAGEVQ
ncbi:rho GTPase-activating protein 30 [Dunckerocampus dactyliophorus]|uniref:rho GTPase-activating protein 30 n=1 Tax=Dunckerocampus dactyliophorus TaxID=161453 RepID=UPI0024062D1A|nr:rho GTPase-activating protein 30 [Dunckerocampus dactyliophorus]